MRTVSSTEAIGLFRQAMHPLTAWGPVTGWEWFDAFLDFHRSIRVRFADASLLLEWGTMPPRLLPGFADLRVGYYPWDATERRWLGLSRQLKAAQQDSDLALRTWAYFDQATGVEPSSN